MKITVKLFATLRNNRFKVSEIETEPGTTIEQMAKQLDIPREEVSLLLINGRDAGLDYVFNDGDTLSLFPPVGGG